MKIILFISIFLLHQTNSLLSQGGYCAFNERLKELVIENSLLESRLDSFQKLVLSHIKLSMVHSRSLISIPVVVHVVWRTPEENISNERILKQIEMLNLVFTNNHDDLVLVPDEFKPVIGNPNLNFCLAAEDPFGNETSGILRIKTDFENIASTDNLFFTETGGSTAWDPSKFLNIWITGPFGNTGYASFPEEGKTHRDGVVLSSHVVDVGNFDKREGNGRVAVHEIGHYLGLHHIWGDDLYAQDSLCQSDDGFSDTPL